MHSDTEPQDALLVGTPAPDFTLPGTSGEKFTLSAWRGRQHVLLAFFPAAFTSVCSEELCAFHEDASRFLAAATQVFGISADLVPSLREFRSKLGIETELLSDAKRHVSRLYGVLDEERFTPRRAYFLVDRSGTLRWRHVEEQGGHRRPNSELLAVLDQLES